MNRNIAKWSSDQQMEVATGSQHQRRRPLASTSVSSPPSFCRPSGRITRTSSDESRRSNSLVKRRSTFPVPRHQHKSATATVQRRCISEPEVGHHHRKTASGSGSGGGEGVTSSANACFRSDGSLSYQPSVNVSSSLMTKLQIAQRSTSSREVKKILSDLQDSCNMWSKERVGSPSGEASPCSTSHAESGCAMLAQLAVDAYYRVVIAKNQGIPTIRRVMTTYPENIAIQASCSSALRLLEEFQKVEVDATKRLQNQSSTTSSSVVQLPGSIFNLSEL